MWDAIETETGGLLCVLFLWLRPLPTNAGIWFVLFEINEVHHEQ
jgi:hypothetical protein